MMAAVCYGLDLERAQGVCDLDDPTIWAVELLRNGDDPNGSGVVQALTEMGELLKAGSRRGNGRRVQRDVRAKMVDIARAGGKELLPDPAFSFWF